MKTSLRLSEITSIMETFKPEERNIPHRYADSAPREQF